MKPADAVIYATGVIPYPSLTSEFHHEIELVVALKAGGTDVSPGEALKLVWGYGVGVDLNRRDIQDEAKKLNRPWDQAKGFDASAPCSAIHPVEVVGHPEPGRDLADGNGEVKLRGDLKDLWSIPEVTSYVAQAVALAPGELFTAELPPV
jgi:fumarylpyruvate hydrolase